MIFSFCQGLCLNCHTAIWCHWFPLTKVRTVGANGKEKTNLKNRTPYKKNQNPNSQNWKTNKINPSTIHCYSFSPEGEKNYIFQSCLWLVYIFLQLTSTSTPIWKPHLSNPHPVTEISKFIVSFIFEKYKIEQWNKYLVHSTWSNTQQLSKTLQ